jgi:hypothetical protein
MSTESEAVMANDELPLLSILWIFCQASSGSFSSFAGLVQVFPLDLLRGFSCSSAAFLSGPARGSFGVLHCCLIGLLDDRVWQGHCLLLTDLTKPELELVVLLPFLMKVFVESWLKRLCEANRWVRNDEYLDEHFVGSHTLCRGLASPTICEV